MSEQTSGKKVVDRNIAIILGIICIILAVALVETKINATSDKDVQIASLESQLADLQNQIGSKESDIIAKENYISAQEELIANYSSLVDDLEAPLVHRIEFTWVDHQTPSSFVTVSGSVFNSGWKTAYNVVETVYIYDASNTLIKTHPINLGNIAEKSYQEFNVDISYSGDADRVM